MTDAHVPNGWTRRRALGWALLALCGFILAFWLRYGLIQPEAIAVLCAQADAPGWCGPREWLILGQYYQVWGWIALAGALVALLVTLPRPILRIVLAIAVVFSTLALVLYNATLGALASVLTLLALARR